MSVDAATIEQLVEEVLDSGRTPEEVCAAAPHLLPAVRARWELCRRVEAMLDDVLPPSTPGGPWAADVPPPGPWSRRLAGGTPPADPLPEVPGYALEAVLGRGGMGVVYRALDVRLRRRVALKMILSGEYASRTERARFLREARAVAALRHPNVVQVYDADEHDGRPYYTMELVDGGTLAARLGGAPLPPAESAGLLAPLAAAVHAAHAAGIVHRDLKPANVLLDAAGGSPKVADFGLARRTDAADGGADDEPVTLSGPGPGPGTPSYMAPEQVAGGRGAVGPAADVYGLGAVLYEMLTGRPPFRGDSPAETARQVLADDPAPPSRLNGRVPRDLETICLTCLHKAPARRYPTAAALADDLGRFLRGEPVAARRTSRPERLAKWVRRRPAAAVAVAAALLAAAAVVGGVARLAADRAATVQAVDEHLGTAVRSQRTGAWAAATAALGRAKDRLGDRGPDELRQRLALAQRDSDLVDRLDKIRVARTGTTGRGLVDPAKTDEDYLTAFRDAGLVATTKEASAAVGARVGGSNVAAAAVAGLDDWAFCASDARRRDWLLAVARAADADPTGWRGRVRDPAVWGDGTGLAAHLAEAPLAAQPVSFLLAAAKQLGQNGRDFLPFLGEIQRAHPGDFWANLSLGFELYKANDAAAALRYLQAAVAVRPDVPAGRNALGLVLAHVGQPTEAAVHLRQGLLIEPNMTAARINLGLALWKTGQTADAVREIEEAVRRQPDDGLYRCRLGDMLSATGRDADALEQYDRALALAPDLAATETAMRAVLTRHGRGDQVRVEWRRALEAGVGREHPLDEQGAYAEYCLYIERGDAYRAARAGLLDALENNRDVRVGERTARACLLMPASGDDLRRATAAIDAALAAERSQPGGFAAYFLFAKGLAEYRAGRMEAAVRTVEGEAARVLGPAPRLVAAMARHRLGQIDEARRALAQAAVAFDWSPAGADNREAWIYHALRREAEAMILPNLPAFLAGTYRPRSADERVALTAVCQATGRTAAEARLWADALADDPGLAAAFRPRALGVAAAAGCGQGADAAGLADADRAALRVLARRWFAEELDAAERLVASADPRDRSAGAAAAANARLRATALRDPDRRARMSWAERVACEAVFARADRAAAASNALANVPATAKPG